MNKKWYFDIMIRNGCRVENDVSIDLKNAVSRKNTLKLLRAEAISRKLFETTD